MIDGQFCLDALFACASILIILVILSNLETSVRKFKRWWMEKRGYIFITHYQSILGFREIEVIDEIIPPPSKKKEKHES